MGVVCWKVFQAAFKSWWEAGFSDDTLANITRLTSWTSDQADKAAKKAANARAADLKKDWKSPFRAQRAFFTDFLSGGQLGSLPEGASRSSS